LNKVDLALRKGAGLKESRDPRLVRPNSFEIVLADVCLFPFLGELHSRLDFD